MKNKYSGELAFLPDRVLIIDGDIKAMQQLANELKKLVTPGKKRKSRRKHKQNKNKSLEVIILEETQSQAPASIPHEDFDLVILDDHGDDALNYQDLLNIVAERSPNATYILLSSETELNKVAARAQAAGRRGAYFLLRPTSLKKQVRDLARSILITYKRSCREAEKKSRGYRGEDNLQLDSLFDEPPEKSGLIKDIETRLGSTINSLKERQDSDGELPDILKAIGYAREAISSLYENGRLNDALRFVAMAREETDNPSLSPLLHSLRAEMMNSVAMKLFDSAQGSYAPALERPEALQRALIGTIEETRGRLERLEEIRPSRGTCAILSVGSKKLYRKEDYKSAIGREAKLLRFYRRISRHFEDVQNLLHVPQLISVVRSQDSSKAVLYRDYVKGTTVLEELRVLHKKGNPMNISDNSLRKKIETARTAILSNAVRQLAYVLAAGPMQLADSIEDPIEDYYIPRLGHRIVEPLNRLLAKGGLQPLSLEQQKMLYESSMPIINLLASLEPAFYKDSFIANSLIQKRRKRRKMFFYDFGSVKQLPLVIDLATQLCYSDFVNPSQNATTEVALVSDFFTLYPQAVKQMNDIVRRYENDKKGFILDEIRYDSETSPSESREELKQLLAYCEGVDFKNPQKDFRDIKRRIKEGAFQISPEYVDDLADFVSYLVPKKAYETAQSGTKEHNHLFQKFTNEYYAALFRRSLLMAGAHAGFIIEQVPRTEKKYLLIKEMIGTLGNAYRGLQNSYIELAKQGKMFSKQRTELSSVLQYLSYALNTILQKKLL